MSKGAVTGAISTVHTASRGFPTNPPRLSISGKDILDHNGNKINLRGINWGHFSQTAFEDIQTAIDWGANCIRMPLRWWGYYDTGVDSRQDSSPGHINPAHLAMLDDHIKWATDRGMWVIFFLDSNCGQCGVQDANDKAYCDPGNVYGNLGHNFWTDLDMRQKFLEAWTFLINRYKDTPYIAMWECLPEPGAPGVDGPGQIAFYKEVIATIRAIDTVTPFLIGASPFYGIQNVEDVYIPDSTPVIYTGNLFCNNGISLLAGRLQSLTDLRDTKKVPILIQQVGVESIFDPDQSIQTYVLQLLNANNVPYTWWEFKGGDTTPDTYGVLYKDAVHPGGWITKIPVRDILIDAFAGTL
jgi:hypothetical protein